MALIAGPVEWSVQGRAARELLRRGEARRDLIAFTEYVYPAYRAAGPHRAVAAKLMAVARGETKRQMIFMPPRHGKSFLGSIHFPALYLGLNPTHEIISASYGAELATDFGRAVRNLVASPEYQVLFDTRLSPDSQAKDRWHTSAGGGYVAAGIGTAITGRGANCLLGNAIITTDQGDVPVKSVVTGAPPRYVLSYDDNTGALVYRRITAAVRREAASFYRVRTASGRVVEFTGDHRFFTPTGYVEARLLAEGDVLLLAVRDGSDAISLFRKEGASARRHAPILQQCMLGARGECQKRQTDGAMPNVFGADAAHAGQPESQSLLFGCLQGDEIGGEKGAAAGCSDPIHTGATLRVLRLGIQAGDEAGPRSILFSDVQGSRPRSGDERPEQPWVAQWRESPPSAAALCAGVSEDEAADFGARQLCVRGVFVSAQIAGSPYRYECRKQQVAELGGALCVMSHGAACCGSFNTAQDAVAMVERVCEPAEVFDITVEGTHCFFANGVLVHNCLNIDDPVKSRAEAESETVRKSVWDWYRSDAYSRLMPGGTVVLTMTRWHADDLAGRLLQQQADGGDQWDVLCLPAINADGTALWEEAYPRPVLDQIRKTLGEYDWFALYEQQPRPPGGGFFREADFLQDGLPISPPGRCASVFATLDTATKTGKDNDGTAVCFWAYENIPNDSLKLLDWDIVQIEGDLLITWLPTIFGRLEDFAKTCGARMGSLGAYIEDKASGTILLQQAQRQGLPAVAIDSKLTSVGKVERAINVSGYVSRQMVKFTETAYNRAVTYKGITKNHLLAQVLDFHVGTKDMGQDDALDAFCYGLGLALGNGDGF